MRPFEVGDMVISKRYANIYWLWIIPSLVISPVGVS
jgi:hypothetical protein